MGIKTNPLKMETFRQREGQWPPDWTPMAFLSLSSKTEEDDSYPSRLRKPGYAELQEEGGQSSRTWSGSCFAVINRLLGGSSLAQTVPILGLLLSDINRGWDCG